VSLALSDSNVDYGWRVFVGDRELPLFGWRLNNLGRLAGVLLLCLSSDTQNHNGGTIKALYWIGKSEAQNA
jgi:hypothetical protein